MLKFILTVLTSAGGLPLKRTQLNRLASRVEKSFANCKSFLAEYFSNIVSDLVRLTKFITFFRPRSRLLTVRSLLVFAALALYFFLGPNTSVKANFPEKVVQPQNQTALVAISDSVTAEIVPTFQTPVRGYISTYFSSFHRGIDIPNPIATPVKPFAEGEVVFAGWESGGFGNTITIEHPLGYVTRYAHLSQINVVVGQKVTLETVIGRVGSTGNSTGSHLHFEVYLDNVAQNPLNYISPQ